MDAVAARPLRDGEAAKAAGWALRAAFGSAEGGDRDALSAEDLARCHAFWANLVAPASAEEAFEAFLCEVSRHSWSGLGQCEFETLIESWHLASCGSASWSSPLIAAALAMIAFSLQIFSPAPPTSLEERLERVFAVQRAFSSVVATQEPALTQSSTELFLLGWRALCATLRTAIRFTREVTKGMVPYRLLVTHQLVSAFARHCPGALGDELAQLLQAWLREASHWDHMRANSAVPWELEVQAPRSQSFRPNQHHFRQLQQTRVAQQQSDALYWNDLVLSAASETVLPEPPPRDDGRPTALVAWTQAAAVLAGGATSAVVLAVARECANPSPAWPVPSLLRVIERAAHRLAKVLSKKPSTLGTPALVLQFWSAAFGRHTIAVLGDARSPQGLREEAKVLRKKVASAVHEVLQWASAVLLLVRGQPAAVDMLLDALWAEVCACSPSHASTVETVLRWALCARLLVSLVAHASALLLPREAVAARLMQLLESVLVDLHENYDELVSALPVEPTPDADPRSLARYCAADALAYALLHRLELVMEARTLSQADPCHPHANLWTNAELLLTDYLPIFGALVSHPILLMCSIFVCSALGLVPPASSEVLQCVHRLDVLITQSATAARRLLATPSLHLGLVPAGEQAAGAMHMLLVSWPCALPLEALPNPHDLQVQELQSLHTTLLMHLRSELCPEPSPREEPAAPRAPRLALMDLPTELLAEVIAFLSYKRVLRLTATSKILLDLVRAEDHRLWRRVYLQTFPKNVFANHLAAYCRQAGLSEDLVALADRVCTALQPAAGRACRSCQTRRRRADRASASSSTAAASSSCLPCLFGCDQHCWRLLFKERVLAVRKAHRRCRSFALCPLVGCCTALSAGKEQHLRRHALQLEAQASKGTT